MTKKLFSFDEVSYEEWLMRLDCREETEKMTYFQCDGK